MTNALIRLKNDTYRKTSRHVSRAICRNVIAHSRQPAQRIEYDTSWIADGFSISPLELPLQPSVFVAKPQPFNGNFGIFEDSLPDGYGRYLLHKTLMRQGINDSDLSSLDRLAIVGDNGIGALTYNPAITL